MMSREDIIRMAREAKIEFDHDGSNSFVFSIDQFEHFASLVAAAKQEECARVCADHPGHIPSNKWNASSALGSCEQAIRALK